MSFIISARTLTGEVRYRRTSVLSALEQSLALLGSGMSEVCVIDLHGLRHTPQEFSRMLVAGANDAGAMDPKTAAATLAA